MWKNNKLLIFIGVLLILFYSIRDVLVNEFWILGLIPIALLGVTFLIIMIFSIVKKNKQSIIIGIFTFLTLIILDSFTWEVFKSERVFEATLKSDLSGVHLVLRANNKFEIVSYNYLTSELFEGNYKIKGNQIIFLDKPYNNSFIPDTVTIIEDKVILKFDELGEPNTQFATYFEIELNKITE